MVTCLPNASREAIIPMYFQLMDIMAKEYSGKQFSTELQPSSGVNTGYFNNRWCVLSTVMGCDGVRQSKYTRQNGISWLNDTIRRHLTCPNISCVEPCNTITIIQRPPEAYRSILNVDDLEFVLSTVATTEIITIGKETPPIQQLCLAINDRNVIAVHGAALALFLFLSTKEHRILEIALFGYDVGIYTDVVNSTTRQRLKLTQNESVSCHKGLKQCTDSERNISGLSWEAVGQLWWPKCRAFARSCNVLLSPHSLAYIKGFFANNARLH